MTVLVTGARGFVGAALLGRLQGEPQWRPRAGSRHPPAQENGVEWVTTPGLSANAEWRPALEGVDAVVHLAAHVHVMSGGAAEDYHRVNVDGSRRLAEQAAVAGVRRFIYLSSVKVHGESGRFTEDSVLAPADAYAVSKRDAEHAIRGVGGPALEVVIIRPPLVYGPGVKANFLSLMTAVRRGVPLPLASIRNLRSLVGVDNLVDLILVCLGHRRAASEAFLVSDGEDLSTPDLIRRMAAVEGRRARLLSMPESMLRIVASLAGRSAAVDRLTGSLQVDISKARRLLGWTPPVPVDEGLRRLARQW